MTYNFSILCTRLGEDSPSTSSGHGVFLACLLLHFNRCLIPSRALPWDPGSLHMSLPAGPSYLMVSILFFSLPFSLPPPFKLTFIQCLPVCKAHFKYRSLILKAALCVESFIYPVFKRRNQAAWVIGLVQDPQSQQEPGRESQETPGTYELDLCSLHFVIPLIHAFIHSTCH